MGKKLFKKKEWDLKTFDGDILLNERADRRVLPDVPDPEGIRSQFDRRGVSADNDSVESVILNRKSFRRSAAIYRKRVYRSVSRILQAWNA